VSGRACAKIALNLIIDLADRVAAAGIDPACAPTLAESVDLVWPLAQRLAKLEKAGHGCGKAAERYRDAVLADVASRLLPRQAPAVTAAVPWRGWAVLDPAAWHVELAPGAADRSRELAS
jgi:hypothetical protein